MILLINYLMAATRQSVTHIRELRRFELMYTLQGSNLSRVTKRFGWIPLLLRNRDSWLHLQHTGWLICWSPPSFSPLTASEVVVLSQAYIDNWLLDLLGPYTSMRLVHSILAYGYQPPVLNRHRRGYNLGGVSFPHHTPHPSQPMVVCFPLLTPPGLRLTISL
jgi:hypothetical protein